jgi:hypothetical protein
MKSSLGRPLTGSHGEYLIHEGALTLPGFVDASVNSLVFDSPSGPIRVDVTRQPMTVRALDPAVAALLLRERRELPSYRSELAIPHTVDGSPAVQTRVAFERDGAAMVARRVHFAAGAALMTIGVSGPVAAREAVDELFEHLLATVRFEAAFRADHAS